MSNPFPKLIVKEVTDGAVLSERAHKLFLFAETGELFKAPTAEQIRYAAHAINQYEALVAALKELEWADYDQCGDPSCRWCGRQKDIGHADDCELGALLAEEVKP